jgi:hypothetical protein
MNKISAALLLLLPFVFLISCSRNTGSSNDVVTRRIQYDVTIKNADPENDWWVQNLEGSSREKLLSDIIGRVTEGKVKAYDFLSCKPYTTDEVRNIMRHVDTISVESPVPPYDLVDTAMVTEIRLSDITRLRFLEEWKMNDKTLAFTKDIAGICPMVERHSDSGELLGYKPLFWVFFNERYPAELLNK